MRKAKLRFVTLAMLISPAVGCDARSAPPSDQSPAATQTAAAGELPTVYLTPAFPRLSFARPVFLTHAGDGSDRIFVVEQPGRIRVFPNKHDVQSADVFLDIKDIVQTRHNEEGLLALAFHPKYADNGLFYIYYSAGKPKRNIVAEMKVSADDPNKADPASQRLLLEVEQPYGNHNGSTLLFGPDGYLYISHGDGGLANDPHGNGQKLSTLLGKITRIDVDTRDGGKPYGIPADNPFVDQSKFPDARPEIWAYGLRNVWRMSFDRATGDLWAGDVGQNAWEEIDLITRGGNYGWNIREGLHPFAEAETASPLIDPVVEYPHSLGLSVTGGYVYRGERFPALKGVYLYGDYATGRLWGLRSVDGKATANGEVLGSDDRTFIASFGEDQAGEVFICAFDRLDGRGGRIMRVTGR